MRILLDALSGCNEKQVKKINNIVMVAYNRLATAETQTKQPMPLVSRAIRGYDTDLLTIIKDKYYNSEACITAVLNVGSFEEGKTYNLISLANTPVNNIVIGNGADDRDHPNTVLSNYGSFQLSGSVIQFECLLKPEKDRYFVEIRAL